MSTTARTAPPLALPRRARSNLGRVALSFIKNIPAVIALVYVAVMVVTAVFAERLAPHDPVSQELMRRLTPPIWMAGGSTDYLLGTDKLGRDILSRLIYGAQVSMFLAFFASTTALIIGVTLGLLSGWIGGTFGDVIMRIADLVIALPFLVVAIAVIAVLGPSFTLLLVLLAAFGWEGFAKVVRGEVLAVKQKEYIEAARLMGAPSLRILWVHVLPNIASPVIVIWTFAVAALIVVESGLSFLGLGIQPPTPAWGTMLSDGRDVLGTAWWVSVLPGMAIMLVVLAINILGDALRDIIDPRTR
ncbi:MAG: ABC transporter permease [Dehalococcoidia bacterium]|nr:ABC transporter permease [Dehalococcoidia bacterium]